MSGYSSLEASTRASVEAATHLDKEGVHAAAIAAMLSAARKIDAWDIIVDWALTDALENETRPAVPANDNVTLSTYLKYLESLGLTPAGQAALLKGKPAPAPKASSKMATLTALQGGKSA